jgi:hypothetical protein
VSGEDDDGCAYEIEPEEGYRGEEEAVEHRRFARERA